MQADAASDEDEDLDPAARAKKKRAQMGLLAEQ